MRIDGFKSICRMTQKELKAHLVKELKKTYNAVVEDDGFVYAQGNVPILLLAHMDTVHKTPPKKFVFKNGKLSSPQGIGGDDRCGIFMIMDIIKTHKCSVLFLEDEECGGIGACKFVKHPLSDGLEFNYLIELDRRDSKDAVFYECDNPEFEDFITKDGDWISAWGSYSDICDIAPALGCAAVNLSCGYHAAHTPQEYVVISEMEENIKKVCKLIERTTENDKFEYIEAEYYGGYYSQYGFGASSYNKTNKYSYEEDELHVFVFTYVDDNNYTQYEELAAANYYEAVGMFLVDHQSLRFDDIIEIEDYGADPYAI